MKLKRIVIHSLVLMLIVFCINQIDLPLAEWISKFTEVHATLIRTSNFPDLLLIFVTVTSSLSWILYFYFELIGFNRIQSYFFKILGTVLPLAYLLKSVMKFLFGRTETRVWLDNPKLHGFHWFNGVDFYDGFPSGHMLVFTPVFLHCWYAYPKYRFIYPVAWLFLAIALIVTDYHFLADVLAGTYVGVMLFYLVIKVVR